MYPHAINDKKFLVRNLVKNLILLNGFVKFDTIGVNFYKIIQLPESERRQIKNKDFGF